MANTLERDVGIDVARAGLIFMMLFYHSFSNAQVASTLEVDPNFNINRWMGLVTGSFPYLMGFLIGFRYLGDVTKGFIEIQRLVVRASKLIIFFLAVNILLMILGPSLDKLTIPLPNTPDFQDILLANSSSVAYDLLMPLGEVALIGAVVVFARMHIRSDLFLLSILTIVAIILAQSGSVLLLYLACGIIGLTLGSVSGRPVVSQVLKRYWVIGLLGFVPGVILAISQTYGPDNALLYLASVAGLFFGFYNLGRFAVLRSDGTTSRIVKLFARSSLMIYIVHIPILKVLTKFSGQIFTETDLWLAFSVFAVFMFVTMGALAHVVDLYRPKFNQGLSRLNILRRATTAG